MSLRKLCLFTPVLLLCSLSSTLDAAELGTKKKHQPKVAEASDEGEIAIKKFKVADGFKIELFAAEPMLANPVCFAIDEKGRFYVGETFRHTDGALDVRKYMSWLDEELAGQTAEDHLAKIKKHLDETPNMTRETERVKLIVDTDGDGKADKATIFADGFTNYLDGIGAGLLARKGDVYYTCIPDLYLLRDRDGDGTAEVRQSLQTGYGVRFAFIGHDLHGLRIGPDGKLYFSIGDRGFNVKQGGETIAFPEGGAVLRCNLDGSDLEIFAYGLRNPQELAFDDYGNLFTGDNNSDGGDQARWVYVVEGADIGWRIGWQYITEPNSRGPWNSEKMWEPQTPGQPAYIVPPLANIGNGPSGITYYPGVGMPEKYNGTFFMCDFRGSAASSRIHSFKMKPKGASFDVVDREDFLSNMLMTDVDFGPDSALYASDWVEGWNKPGKGRLYRILHPEAAADPVVEQTKQLLAESLEQRTVRDLVPLLSHRDQRVRQEAQFALAGKGDESINALQAVAGANSNRLARIHAVWGLGQIAAASNAKEAPLGALRNLLADNDPEIRVQAAKVLGDNRFVAAGEGLIPMINNVNEPRGQFYAAMAAGKMRYKAAIPAVLEMLRANADADAYLRHAGVTALVWMGDSQAILNATKDNSPAVRLATAVALRRLQRSEIASLLHDKQGRVVVEAARAINDLPIVEALPELASLIVRPNYDEALFRRVLNANFRLGTPANAAALAKFAADPGAPATLRAEALEMLTEWEEPSDRDRVTGLWRPLQKRERGDAIEAVQSVIPDLVITSPDRVRMAALQLAGKFKLNEALPAAFDLVSNEEVGEGVRVQALRLLEAGQYPELLEAVKRAATSQSEEVRNYAVKIKAKLAPGDATTPLVAILENGTTGEKQNALATLASLGDPAADRVLASWLDKLVAGSVPSELQLDLLEAAAKRESAEIKDKLAKFEAARGSDPLALYRECLAGGDADEGKKIFFERVEASCVRCHKIKGEGGEAGPILDTIGATKTREYLLESIVDPNAQVAAGFESVMITLKNGTSFAGTLKSENSKEVVLNSPEDGVVTLKKKDVTARERGLSGMPPELAQVLSKQDIRNLIEFLATLK